MRDWVPSSHSSTNTIQHSSPLSRFLSLGIPKRLSVPLHPLTTPNNNRSNFSNPTIRNANPYSSSWRRSKTKVETPLVVFCSYGSLSRSPESNYQNSWRIYKYRLVRTFRRVVQPPKAAIISTLSAIKPVEVHQNLLLYITAIPFENCKNQVYRC